MELLSSNWENIYFRFILWGILLLVIFRLLSFGLRVLIKDEKLSHRIRRTLPTIELIFWSMFFTWFIFIFAQARSLFVFVVLAVLLSLLYLLFRFWISDLVAGVIFRAKNNYQQDDILLIDKFSGQIKKLGHISIELETHDGKTIYYPYSKIVSSINIKSESTEQISGYTFDLMIESKETPDLLKNQIKNFTIALPWYSTQNAPAIKLIAQENNSFIFQITYYPVDKSFALKIKQMIIEQYGKEVTQ